MTEILFSKNIYTTAVKESCPSESLLTVVLYKPLTFKYEKIAYSDFSKIYSTNNGSSGWMGRKILAIPGAVCHILLAIKDVVMAIFTLPAALFDKDILRRRVFSVARHIEWAFGAVSCIFSDKHGLYRMQKTEFELACYSWHGSSPEKQLKLGRQSVNEQYPTVSSLNTLEDKEWAKVLSFASNAILQDPLITKRLETFDWNLFDYNMLTIEQFYNLVFQSLISNNKFSHNTSDLITSRMNKLSTINLEKVIRNFISNYDSFFHPWQLLLLKNLPIHCIPNLLKDHMLLRHVSINSFFPDSVEAEAKFHSMTAEQLLTAFDDINLKTLVQYISAEQLKNEEVRKKCEVLLQEYPHGKWQDRRSPPPSDELFHLLKKKFVYANYPTADALNKLSDKEFAKALPFSLLHDPLITKRLETFDWNLFDYSQLDAQQICDLFFQSRKDYNKGLIDYPLCEERIARLSKNNIEIIWSKLEKTEILFDDALRTCVVGFMIHTPSCHIRNFVDFGGTDSALHRWYFRWVFTYVPKKIKERFQQLTADQILRIFHLLRPEDIIECITRQQLQNEELNKKYDELVKSQTLNPEAWEIRLGHLKALGINPKDQEFRERKLTPDEKKIVEKAYKKQSLKCHPSSAANVQAIQKDPQAAVKIREKWLQLQTAKNALIPESGWRPDESWKK